MHEGTRASIGELRNGLLNAGVQFSDAAEAARVVLQGNPPYPSTADMGEDEKDAMSSLVEGFKEVAIACQMAADKVDAAMDGAPPPPPPEA